MSVVNESTFQGIDLGTTQPVAVSNETVEVEISTDVLLRDFAKAFVAEAYRVNPLKAEQVQLTNEEVYDYCTYLLKKRVDYVHLNCPEWRKLKALYIPSFIQYSLAMIGEVVMRDRGLTFIPECTAETITFDEAYAISAKIGSFEQDLQIVRDGMPRSIEGDPDVMSSALIAGYVRAIKPVSHPISTYVAAFLGFKLREEVSFKVLYRIQYDDLNFIATALLTEKRLF